ncbi:MAG: cell division protein FtsL [Rickettsiella sp.]|nr:cell division protein FtsL [Rickettsiella sp.]
MNVAARALARGTLTWERKQWWKWQISLRMLGVILLLLAVASSALSVVYVKALQRNLYSELQAREQERDDLKTEWSQLLLEENTWAAPVRIQTLAQQKLGMEVPQSKAIILLTRPT